MFECVRCKKKYLLKASADKCLGYHRDQEWKKYNYNPANGIPKVIQTGEQWMCPLSKKMFPVRAEAEACLNAILVELGVDVKTRRLTNDKNNPQSKRLHSQILTGKTTGLRIARDGIHYKCPLCQTNHVNKERAINCLRKCADKEGYEIIDMAANAKPLEVDGNFSCSICTKKHDSLIEAQVCVDVCKINAGFKFVQKQVPPPASEPQAAGAAAKTG